jgi:hypothetical protein
MRYSSKLRNVTKLVGVCVAALAFGLIALPAGAQNSGNTSIAAPEPKSTPLPPAAKPKTAAHSTFKPYFIEFRSRAAASYGHMYVLYGQVNGRNEIVKSDIAGLHPAGDRNDCENCSVYGWTIGHLIPVPSETGASDGDLEEKYVTARYRVMVDAAEYKRVSAYIKKLQADNPTWHALWNNCVGFGRNVAQFMGLQLPTFIWLEPKDFVEHLQDLNGGGPKQGPLKDAPRGASVAVSSRLTPATTPAATPVSNPGTAPTPTSSTPPKPKKQPVASAPAAATTSAAAGTTHSTPN